MADVNKITAYMPANLATHDADKPYKPSKTDKFMFTLPAHATVGDFFAELAKVSGLSGADLVAFYEENKTQKSITLQTSNHDEELASYIPKSILKDGHFNILKAHKSPENLY